MSSKKKTKNKQAPVDWRQSFRSWFQDRNPIMKFLLGFIGCMSLFYLFYYSGLYRNHLELPFLNGQVRFSNALLHLFGQATEANGTLISSADFSVNVKNGCDGLEAMAILVSGIIIFPVALKYKFPGIAVGILILLVANIFRIAGLYLAGKYFSSQVFDILHIQGGFIIFTLLSILLWFIWMNWATDKSQKSVSS